MLKVLIATILIFFSILNIQKDIYAQTNESTSNDIEPLSPISDRDRARQTLLDPQKFIEMCELHYQPGVETLPWSPVGQMGRYLFYIAEVQTDDDFLGTLLMTYIYLGLEEFNYNDIFDRPSPIVREPLPEEPQSCEDYIHVVAIEAATHIQDDESLKQKFEEFKGIHNSWIPYALLSNIDDVPYVVSQIRKQANKNISPEETTPLDHTISRFIRRLHSDIRYRDIANTIVDPLAHSAINPLIRVAALETTIDTYILNWHASYNPTSTYQPIRENDTFETTFSPFYISEDEDVMQMYKQFAQRRLLTLGLPAPR